MQIKNLSLQEAIYSSLLDHDNQHFDEPDNRIDFSGITEYEDDSMEFPDDELRKLENFRMTFNTKYFSEEELQNTIEELKKVLSILHLEYFSIQPLSKAGPVNIDLSFLKSLNTDIENIFLTNVDLSNEIPEIFDRFDSLKQLMLEKCNISDPELVKNVSKDTRISLCRNYISPEHFEKAVSIAEASNAGISFDGELASVGNAFKNKVLKLSEYLELKDKVDFSSLDKLKVLVDIDVEKENAEVILEALNGASNITLESEISKLKKLDPEGKLNTPTRAIIKNASELGVDELNNRSNITSVRMEDGENTCLQQGEPYEIDDYKKARGEIDKILRDVVFPEESDPDREKKIFAQIYKEIGKKIRYNYHAISEEGKKDDALQISCRNLTDGLLKNTAVCAGYADILRNTLACAGIYSEYIGASLDLEGGVTVDLNDPEGHAWNRVRLDGDDYWTDLTWDANNILTGRYPLNYCLKSSKDFGHSQYRVGINNEKWAGCDKTISDEKQLELFEGISVEKTANIEEAKSVSKVSSLVLATAQKGLTANALQVLSKEAENLCMLPVKAQKLDESDKEI